MGSTEHSQPVTRRPPITVSTSPGLSSSFRRRLPLSGGGTARGLFSVPERRSRLSFDDDDSLPLELLTQPLMAQPLSKVERRHGPPPELHDDGSSDVLEMRPLVFGTQVRDRSTACLLRAVGMGDQPSPVSSQAPIRRVGGVPAGAFGRAPVFGTDPAGGKGRRLSAGASIPVGVAVPERVSPVVAAPRQTTPPGSSPFDAFLPDAMFADTLDLPVQHIPVRVFSDIEPVREMAIQSGRWRPIKETRPLAFAFPEEPAQPLVRAHSGLSDGARRPRGGGGGMSPSRAMTQSVTGGRGNPPSLEEAPSSPSFSEGLPVVSDGGSGRKPPTPVLRQDEPSAQEDSSEQASSAPPRVFPLPEPLKTGPALSVALPHASKLLVWGTHSPIPQVATDPQQEDALSPVVFPNAPLFESGLPTRLGDSEPVEGGGRSAFQRQVVQSAPDDETSSPDGCRPVSQGAVPSLGVFGSEVSDAESPDARTERLLRARQAAGGAVAPTSPPLTPYTGASVGSLFLGEKTDDFVLSSPLRILPPPLLEGSRSSMLESAPQLRSPASSHSHQHQDWLETLSESLPTPHRTRNSLRLRTRSHARSVASSTASKPKRKAPPPGVYPARSHPYLSSQARLEQQQPKRQSRRRKLRADGSAAAASTSPSTPHVGGLTAAERRALARKQQEHMSRLAQPSRVVSRGSLKDRSLRGGKAARRKPSRLPPRSDPLDVVDEESGGVEQEEDEGTERCVSSLSVSVQRTASQLQEMNAGDELDEPELMTFPAARDGEPAGIESETSLAGMVFAPEACRSGAQAPVLGLPHRPLSDEESDDDVSLDDVPEEDDDDDDEEETDNETDDEQMIAPDRYEQDSLSGSEPLSVMGAVVTSSGGDASTVALVSAQDSTTTRSLQDAAHSPQSVPSTVGGRRASLQRVPSLPDCSEQGQEQDVDVASVRSAFAATGSEKLSGTMRGPVPRKNRCKAPGGLAVVSSRDRTRSDRLVLLESSRPSAFLAGGGSHGRTKSKRASH
jgi:hypothetical protein